MSNNNVHTSNDSIDTFDVKSKITIPNGPFGEPLSQLTEKSNNVATLLNETSSFNDTSLDIHGIPNIDQSTLDTTLDTTTISIKMSNFDVDNPSTHLFVKPARGSLYQWGYESRKYLFIFLLKPLTMNQMCSKYKRQSQQITFKKVRDQYKNITGQNMFPPFFQLHRRTQKYVQMTDTEISDYIDNMLKNISRVRNTIKRFSEELNNNNNEIEDNNNNNNINDNNNNIINDNLIVSPQEIVDLSTEVASNSNDRKRKELFDIISSFKNNNCKKKRNK